MAEIEVFDNAAHLANAAADRFVNIARTACAKRGRFNVALSGGSTPIATYRLLASAEFSRNLEWDQVHLFWGDERCVPPSHLLSNYRLVQQSLIDKISIPDANIHRMLGEIEPAQAASRYESELRSNFSLQLPTLAAPSFDLILLGLGVDGHTASLFPNDSALQVSDSWVAVVEHEHGPPPLVKRLTLTLPVINAAEWVIFLVSGEKKASTLKQVRSVAGDLPPLPAQLIKPASGQLNWMIDEAAAGDL